MATAKKLPSGSWRCRVYDYTDDAGKKIYRSFTSSEVGPRGKREAEYLAAEFAAGKKESGKAENIIFSDALKKYISDKTPVLSPSTIRGYLVISNCLDREFYQFCQKRVGDISADDVQNVINISSGKVSPKTVRNRHGLISAVLSVYRPEFALKTTLPQKIRPNLYIPVEEDISRLLEAVKDTELEIPVMLGAFGTMRRGEICALAISDIKGNIAHVHQSMVEDSSGNLSVKTTKTYSGDRFVDLPDFVIAKIIKKGYITNLKPHSITIMFNRILDKNDIPHFRFHDLRHYSASVLHALGMPDAYVMQRGGWGNDGVLKNIYRHTLSDHEKGLNDMANKYFKDTYMTQDMTHK